MLAKRTQKYLQEYSKKVLKYKCEVILLITFAVIIWVLAYLIPWDIIPIFFPTFSATFAGVLLSFLLLNCLRRREARKAAVHVLATIWLELRHNNKIAEDIRKNFVFPEDRVGDLQFVTKKISNLRTWASELQDKSYYAGQQSRAFFEIKGDKVYNAVNIAYYDLKLLREVLLTAQLSLSYFLSAAATLSRTGEGDIPKEYVEKSIEEHIDKCKKEIDTSLRHIGSALDELVNILKKYGVTPAEESRDN